MRGFLTTQEVADRLGITTGRVRQMIMNGQLPATKFGRDNVIRESDLELVADRKVGRPFKNKDAATSKKPKASKPKKKRA